MGREGRGRGCGRTKMGLERKGGGGWGPGGLGGRLQQRVEPDGEEGWVARGGPLRKPKKP